MPGDPFQRVALGDPVRFNAQLHNAMVEAVVAHRRGGKFGARAASTGTPEGLIYIGNDSGDDVDRFAVLGIENILWGPDDNLAEFQNNAALMGVTPTKASHTGQYVITYEPIPKNGIGRASIFGIAVCKVNILVDGDDTADVADHDMTQLESGPIGSAQILWVEEGTGTKWAVVRIGNGSLPPFPVTLTSDGGSAGTNNPPTQATLTYTVHHAKNGRFIANNVAVWPARQYGHVTAATKGYCDRIGDVTYVVQHDEVLDAGVCA